MAAEGGERGGRSAAVVAGRAAEQAMTQAEALLDGIGRLGADLAAAGERIATARAETEQDIAEARALLAAGDSGGASGELSGLVARAEAALASATAAQNATPPDPMAALRLIDEADTALDRGLVTARDAQAASRRAAAARDQALLTARPAVAAAEDFIASRRGAVGTDARTRLAEAQRHLAQAQVPGINPAAALAEAQAADTLARQSLDLARSDVSRWSSGGGAAGGTAAASRASSAGWSSAGSWPAGSPAAAAAVTAAATAGAAASGVASAVARRAASAARAAAAGAAAAASDRTIGHAVGRGLRPRGERDARAG